MPAIAEFVADLYELSPPDQLRYTAGVLAQAMTLRAALGASRSSARAVGLATTQVLSWRCRLIRMHQWVGRSTEDGGRFQLLPGCGIDRGPVGYGPASTPPWPGNV